MKNLGIVEGFYGESLDFDDRNSIIRLLSENNLNYYLYAPKEDPFLRSYIDIDHTENWLKDFDDFLEFSKKMDVEVGLGLAPIKKNNLEALKKKVKNFSDLGNYSPNF